MKSGTRPSRRSRGLTAVELLVTIGIIGIVAALILPAIQASREASRRIQCANNLKQIMLATHSFQTANGGFPTSGFWTFPASNREPKTLGGFSMHGVYSIHGRILPYLEQDGIYNDINFSLPNSDLASVGIFHYTEAIQSISAFLCPSDPKIASSPLAPTSYRGCAGLGEREFTANGLLQFRDDGSFIGKISQRDFSPLSSIADGLSNTLAFAEKPIGTISGTYAPFRDWVRRQSGSLPLRADDWIVACSKLGRDGGGQRLDAGASWMLTGAIYTLFFASTSPNSTIPDCGDETFNGVGLFSARSYHPGGVNAAMADGSVRWFSATTSVATWRGHGTRAGGEPGPEN